MMLQFATDAHRRMRYMLHTSDRQVVASSSY